MRAPSKMMRIVAGKRYDVEKAELLCGNDWWDGHNFERGGTNCFLYRTPGGRYFFVNWTQWSGERDSIEPCTQSEAQEFYEGCAQWDCERVVFEDAFPGAKVEDA